MQAQCRALDLKGEDDARIRGMKAECCYRDVRRHSTYPIIYCLSKDFLPNGSHGIARGWVPGCSRPPTGLPPDTRNTGEVRLVRGTSRTSVRGRSTREHRYPDTGSRYPDIRWSPVSDIRDSSGVLFSRTAAMFGKTEWDSCFPAAPSSSFATCHFDHYYQMIIRLL